MADYDTTLPDRVVDVTNRVKKLELALFETTAQADDSPGVVIGNITYTTNLLPPDVNGIRMTKVVWSWVAPPEPSKNDVAPDPVVDYMVSVTPNTLPENRPYISSGKSTSLVTLEYPGTTVVFKVYAVTKKGTKGPVKVASADIGLDATIPNQPSTPKLSSDIARVGVVHDGMDSSDVRYTKDIDHIEVHRVYSNDLLFEPSSQTLYCVISVGGVVSIPSDDSYNDISVRFVAVSKSNVKSSPSTGVSAKPKKVIKTDMGMPVLETMPYTDTDNMITNGAFSDTFYNNEYIKANPDSHNFTIVDKALKYTGVNSNDVETWRITNDSPTFPIIPLSYDSSYILTFKCKSINVATDGVIKLSGNIFTASATTVNFDIPITNNSEEYTPYTYVIHRTQAPERLQLMLSVYRVGTGEVWFDEFQLRRVINGQYIENASIANAHIANLAVDDAKISSVAVGKLTAGSISADQYVAAGNLANIHARLDPYGFSSYQVDADGGQYKATSIGSPSGNDSLLIRSGDGVNILNVNSNSKQVYINSLDTSPSGVTRIYGVEFMEHLNKLTKVVAYGKLNNASRTAYKGMELPYMELRFLVEPGYTYIAYTSFLGYLSQGSSVAVMNVNIREANGAAVSVNSPIISQSASYDQLQTYYAGIHSTLITVLSEVNAATEKRLLVTHKTSSPTTTADNSCGSRLYNANMVVLRTPRVIDAGIDVIPPAESTPPAPPVVSRQFTSEWVASSSATFRGDGSQRTDTNNIRQGYVGQQNGDQYGIAVFMGGAISGETGVTIGGALWGNLTIHSVQAYLYSNFTYYNAGGTAIVSAHDATGVTNYVPNTQKKNISGFSRGSGQWFDITDIFKAWHRGIWVGKTSTSNLNYYCWFDGATEANPPRLKITYTRVS